MRRGKRVWYENVLNIPEAEDGGFAIKHQIVPAGVKFQTANFRTAFHAGHKAKEITFDHPTRWHQLLENGGVWMSDLPIEQWQADETIKPMRGRVLVGGLGLGYVATALAAKGLVDRVVVVEKSVEVCTLVWPYISYEQPKIRLVHADLFEYLKNTNEKFDWGFYDIWASDGEGTFHFTVVPLYQLSQGKVKEVRNWNEDVMRGQLFHGLWSRLEHGHMTGFDPEKAAHPLEGEEETSIWVNWMVPYWRWYVQAKPTKELAIRVAVHYTNWMYRGQGPEALDKMLELATFMEG